MKTSEYNTKLKRLEKLLKQLTEDGKLTGSTQKQLDQLSNQIQEYEEKHYPFKVDSLKEMIELRMFQRKFNPI